MCYSLTLLKITTLLRPPLPPMMKVMTSPKSLMSKLGKKFEKDNETVRGHALNHMSNPLFDLFIIFKSAKLFGRNRRSSTEMMTLERRNMWLVKGYVFKLPMTSQS